jgi:hypothetical protein
VTYLEARERLTKLSDGSNFPDGRPVWDARDREAVRLLVGRLDDTENRLAMILNYLVPAAQPAEPFSKTVQRLVWERDEAREWVRRMVREGQELRCAFCGQPYPPGTPGHNDTALVEHIRTCEKHPMRALEAKLEMAMAKNAAHPEDRSK